MIILLMQLLLLNIVKPELFGSQNKQKKAFSLLQIALARLATKNGWTLEPNLQQ